MSAGYVAPRGVVKSFRPLGLETAPHRIQRFFATFQALTEWW